MKVLPPTSFATRFKQYSETRHVFGRLGLTLMVVMLALGVFSWFDPSEAMKIADIGLASGEALVVGGHETPICVRLPK